MAKRRRGSRLVGDAAARPAPPAVRAPRRPRDRRHPPAVPAALDDVAIVIADDPSPEQLRENGLEADETLYGLYEGVPRSRVGRATGSRSRRRILLFRLPLEEDFPDPDDLADEVRITILHELAHHLGIDDEDRLAELGID